MRKYLVASVLGACLLVLGSGAAAFAGGSTYYVGKNIQGQKLLFSVDQTASGPKFDPLFTTMIDHCPATGTTITIQFSFSGFQIPITNGKFNLSLNDLSDLFNWNGFVTSKGAAGTQSFQLAAFDNTGGLQDCATGLLPWKAVALVPGSVKAAAAGAAWQVKITKAANGSVQFSITH